MDDLMFQERYWQQEPLRHNDERDQYQRDKSRIIHSSAFRRLQAKTQIMGVGEGDFHRTRLTHSIEAAQIGEGLIGSLTRTYRDQPEFCNWLPSRDLLTAACLAHDLGHPPFGHAGEKILYKKMLEYGGFEGNGQTLRIITKLDKYKPLMGTNPTRRLILAVLKYPVKFSRFDRVHYIEKPPKCYFDTEDPIVVWAVSRGAFKDNEVNRFLTETRQDGKPKHRTLDCAIMEQSDDIAYGVHDLEDIVAREMVKEEEVMEKLRSVFYEYGENIGEEGASVSLDDFRYVFGEHHERKEVIGKLVNLFVTSIRIEEKAEFSHPLMRLTVKFCKPIEELLRALKKLAYELVIQKAEIQHMERRGQRIVDQLFDVIIDDPERLIPLDTWRSYDEEDSAERRVCDYIAGMTDRYAEKIYRRLFIPGQGSSHDEL